MKNEEEVYSENDPDYAYDDDGEYEADDEENPNSYSVSMPYIKSLFFQQTKAQGPVKHMVRILAEQKHAMENVLGSLQIDRV